MSSDDRPKSATDLLKLAARGVKELDKHAVAREWDKLLPSTRELSQTIVEVIQTPQVFFADPTSDLVASVKELAATAKSSVAAETDASIETLRQAIARLARSIVSAARAVKPELKASSSFDALRLRPDLPGTGPETHSDSVVSASSNKELKTSTSSISSQRTSSNDLTSGGRLSFHGGVPNSSPSISVTSEVVPNASVKKTLFETGFNPSAPVSPENPSLAYLLAAGIFSDLEKRGTNDSTLSEAWESQGSLDNGQLHPRVTSWLCLRFDWAESATKTSPVASNSESALPPRQPSGFVNSRSSTFVSPARNISSSHSRTLSAHSPILSVEDSSSPNKMVKSQSRTRAGTSGISMFSSSPSSRSSSSNSIPPASGDSKYAFARPHAKIPGIFSLKTGTVSQSNTKELSEMSMADPIATVNLSPGKALAMTTENAEEKLVAVHSTEYRIWDPYKSKLAAAISCGLSSAHPPTAILKRGDKVLVAGDSEDAVLSSASHISDIVGVSGYVYLRLFTDKMRGSQTFAQFLQSRPNVGPMRGAHALLLDCVVVQDSPDAVSVCDTIAKKLLKPGGTILICCSAADFQHNSTSDEPSDSAVTVFKSKCSELTSRLKEVGLGAKQSLTLEPFFSDVIWVVLTVSH